MLPAEHFVAQRRSERSDDAVDRGGNKGNLDAPRPRQGRPPCVIMQIDGLVIQLLHGLQNGVGLWHGFAWRSSPSVKVGRQSPPAYSIGESPPFAPGVTKQVSFCFIPMRLRRRALWLFASVTVLASVAVLTALTARSDEPASDSVGTIDGVAIAISGPMRVEVVGGFPRTVLRSGSDVLVKSGTARLDLTSGGSISICGPAHFSVLKAGNLITLALDSGTIHLSIERGPTVTIYTPLLQIQPIAIGDGPQDALVGFDATGAMCVRAYRGAVRLEQQLTSQNIVVPQSADVLLVNGQLDGLRAGGDRCSCDPQLTKYSPPPHLEVVPPTAPTEDANAKPMGSGQIVSPLPLDKPAAKEGPIYEILVPPLIYNADAEVQPDVDISQIVVLRRVRVRPTLIFQGRVEGDLPGTDPPAAAAGSARPATANPPKATAQSNTPRNNSVVDRMVHFVRKLWSRGS